ncbi:carbon-nitrogen hydrolase family protein [Rhodococcus koreensis]
MSFKKTRAAVVQAEPVWLDARKSTEKAISLIEEASKQNVELLAFPETFIPGYPWWIWHGPLSYGIGFVSRYHANSISRTGPEIRMIAAAARKHRVNVVVGFSEYDRGSLYMSQATITDTGQLIAVRRKLKPTHVERSVFGDGCGVDLQVHDLPIGRVGALNCWEHFQPLSKYAMYSMGEQIHVASWPNMSNYTELAPSFGPEVTNAVNLSYAVEGQVFNLESHNTISEEGLALFCHDATSERFLRAGGGCSRIWGPDGASLGTPLGLEEEGLLIADLDFENIELARSAADPVGHYSRPDVFQVHLNRAPARHLVEVFDGEAPARPSGTHTVNGVPTSEPADLLGAAFAADNGQEGARDDGYSTLVPSAAWERS